jgi:hypothetical protein
MGWVKPIPALHYLYQTFEAFAQPHPHDPFYFWLNPKVTKDQEPIKGDFAFGKPRSLLPLHAFIAGLTNSAFLFLFCIIELSDHYISSTRPTIAIPLVAPHITGDGFDSLS